MPDDVVQSFSWFRCACCWKPSVKARSNPSRAVLAMYISLGTLLLAGLSAVSARAVVDARRASATWPGWKAIKYAFILLVLPVP